MGCLVGGDPGLEAVAVIALPSLAEPHALRLVAADLVDGRAVPIGSYELAPGTEVRALSIEDGSVVAHLMIPGSGPKASSKEEIVRWRPVAGKPVGGPRDPSRP